MIQIVWLEIFFPFGALALAFLWARARGSSLEESFGFTVRVNLLFVLALTEGLSLFHAVGSRSLTLGWLGWLLAWLVALRRTRIGPIPWPRGLRWPLALLLVVFGPPLFALAVGVAPNNWDSMTYHLARVAEWWQRGSVAHYPTHILFQLTHPPLAEYCLLQVYALTQGDRFLALLQFFCWLGIPLQLWRLHRLVGRDSFPLGIAAMLALSLPLGLLEATTTQNDLFLSFLGLGLVVDGSAFFRESSWRRTGALGLSLGFFWLTKGTAYLLTPFLVAAGFCLARPGKKVAWRESAAALALALLLNGPYYARNVATFGIPLPSGERTGYFSHYQNPAELVSSLARSAALQLNLPFSGWNAGLNAALATLHSWLGVSLSQGSTTFRGGFGLPPAFFYEDLDGNFLFFLGALLCLLLAPFPRYRRMLPVLVISALSFVFLTLALRWQSWGARFSLPLFFLAVPAVAASLETAVGARRGEKVALLLAACSLPYVFSNAMKPLMPFEGRGESVFASPRITQYFLGRPALFPAYRRILEDSLAHGCSRLAISAQDDSYEYPLWALLGAPGEEISLRHVGVENASRDQPERSLVPCGNAQIP